MNWKELFNRYTHSIWLQVIVCVLLLWGGAGMVGKTFGCIENSSSTHVAGNEESTVQDDGSNPLDALFEESGAFGNWDEFSEMPRTSSETVRPSRPASRPQSSAPAQEPSSEPSAAESSEEAPVSQPESSEDSLPPEPPTSAPSEGGGDSPEEAVSIITPEEPTGPDSSVSETVPDPPVESVPETPAVSEPPQPSEPEAPVSSGGDTPVSAPDANPQG